MIGPDTALCGVVLHPAGHTRSPAMHNAAFAALGLDAVYVAFDVAPASLEAAVAGARALGVRQLAVSIPHKETIGAHLDAVDETARAIGAVNTVTREGNRLLGVEHRLAGRGPRLAARGAARRHACRRARRGRHRSRGDLRARAGGSLRDGVEPHGRTRGRPGARPRCRRGGPTRRPRKARPRRAREHHPGGPRRGSLSGSCRGAPPRRPRARRRLRTGGNPPPPRSAGRPARPRSAASGCSSSRPGNNCASGPAGRSPPRSWPRPSTGPDPRPSRERPQVTGTPGASCGQRTQLAGGASFPASRRCRAVGLRLLILRHGAEELRHSDRRVPRDLVDRREHTGHARQEVGRRVLAVGPGAVVPDRDLVDLEPGDGPGPGSRPGPAAARSP